MLFDGLVDTLSLAEGQLTRGEIQEKGKSLSKAVRILSGLQNALDDQQGGEIAANLAELYDYCIRRVLHANLKNDADAVREVRGLIDEVRDAWSQIPDLIQQPVANVG
jgi:flagellar protein FliS